MNNLTYKFTEHSGGCESGRHELVVIIPGFGQNIGVTQALATELVNHNVSTLAYEQARYLHAPHTAFGEKVDQIEELLGLPDVWLCPQCNKKRSVILLAHSQGSTLIGLAFERLLNERDLSQLHRTTVMLFNPEIPLIHLRSKTKKLLLSIQQWFSIIRSLSQKNVRRYMISTIGFLIMHPRCAYADLVDSGKLTMDKMAVGYRRAVQGGVKISYNDSSGDPWFDERSSRKFCDSIGIEMKVFENHSHDWIVAHPEASALLIKNLIIKML